MGQYLRMYIVITVAMAMPLNDFEPYVAHLYGGLLVSACS
jgi:type IV secretory pathway component VirB8